jgi:hypothetical protein
MLKKFDKKDEESGEGLVGGLGRPDPPWAPSFGISVRTRRPRPREG